MFSSISAQRPTFASSASIHRASLWEDSYFCLCTHAHQGWLITMFPWKWSWHRWYLRRCISAPASSARRKTARWSVKNCNAKMILTSLLLMFIYYGSNNSKCQSFIPPPVSRLDHLEIKQCPYPHGLSNSPWGCAHTAMINNEQLPIGVLKTICLPIYIQRVIIKTLKEEWFFGNDLKPCLTSVDGYSVELYKYNFRKKW